MRTATVEVAALRFDTSANGAEPQVTPASARHEQVVSEAPLEIRIALAHESTRRADGEPSTADLDATTVAVTMRTPGNDQELALGFLLSEGIVRRRDEVWDLHHCVDPSIDGAQQGNIVTAVLAEGTAPELRGLERHFFASSACGVCGRAGIERLLELGPPVRGGVTMTRDEILGIPARLRRSQPVFDATGGLHAAGLLEPGAGKLLVREDVGRHNAVDKVVGAALWSGDRDLSETLLAVSGRAGFEIVQKAAAARIPFICSVSAPTSLAVELASALGLTLVGFLRDSGFNVYAGAERIDG